MSRRPSNAIALPSLLAFLSKEFASGATVDPGQKLVPDLVDSLGVFVLVDFVEQEWGLVVNDKELTAENLATPKAFSALIESKLHIGKLEVAEAG
jgi:acyl carrier protein